MLTAAVTTGSVARSARDRVDILLFGHAAAATHRVTRFLDPAKAASMRADAYRRIEWLAAPTSGRESAPLGKVCAVHDRLNRLLGISAERAGSEA